MIFDDTIRLSRDWLSQETAELLWVDQHQTVGLHILPQPKIVPGRPTGTQYYDLQVKGELPVLLVRAILTGQNCVYELLASSMVWRRRSTSRAMGVWWFSAVSNTIERMSECDLNHRK